jgi:hypothetical protein
MAYTKLFNSIITSTIWSEDDQTRIVWITMLAIADKNGEVQGSIPGLARIAGVPVEACRSAITKFLSPDVDSRTKDDEGRRIELIDGGWHLLNHSKYRDMASDADRAEKSAIRQARHREKMKRNASTCPQIVTHSNTSVTPESHQIPQADTDTDTNTDTNTKEDTETKTKSKARGTLEELQAYAVEIGLPASDGEFMFHNWSANGWMNGKSPCKDWKSGINKYKLCGYMPSQKNAVNFIKPRQLSKFDIL